MELVEFGALTDADRHELEGDEADPFDGARIRPLEWRGKDRHVGLRDPDGRLVASAGLVLAEIEAGGRTLTVAGIGGVIVARAYRGRGLGDRVIEAALALASTLGPEIALLFCHDDRAGLYRRHGFAEIEPPVLVEQPEGLVEMSQVTMWRALREGAVLPQGPVTVSGLPF